MKKSKFLALTLCCSFVFSLISSGALYASNLDSRSIIVQDSSQSAVTNYLLEFYFDDTTDPVNTVMIQFCSNSPIFTDSCDLPVGIDTTSADLSSQVGNTGFSLNNSTNGTLLLSRNPSVPNSSYNQYDFSGITNPSYTGQYYARISTYSTSDTTQPYLEEGGIALEIVPHLTVSTTVPPYITFCVAQSIPELNCNSATGDNINLGDFHSNSTSSGSFQFLVATNIQSGYVIAISGNTLTSGNNLIPSLTSPSPPQFGVSQFGINLVANTNPSVGQNYVGDPSTQIATNYGQANLFTFNSGDTIAYSTQPSGFTRFTTSVMVNINASQAPGLYSSTITYIASADY
jgi:hypothetical protein